MKMLLCIPPGEKKSPAPVVRPVLESAGITLSWDGPVWSVLTHCWHVMEQTLTDKLVLGFGPLLIICSMDGSVEVRVYP